MGVIFSGRCSIWGRWKMTPVAPRTELDVSWVIRINHDSYFRGRRSIW